MKTAVCLHGLARGSTEPAFGAYGEKYKTLLSKIGNADVYIHSWDVDIQDELVDIFKPVDTIFETQRSFDDELAHFSRFNVHSTNTRANQGNIFKTLSFTYSRMKSIDLKSRFETAHDIKYDCVLTCRFDVGHLNSGLNKTSHLHFNPQLDMSKVYQAYWNQTNAGASDHWFYSNTSNMDVVGNLYYDLFTYLKPDSDYARLCKNGWPYSNSESEFSDEMFSSNPKHSMKLTVDDTLLVNNHCLYKYHLLSNDLWVDKSVFLNREMWE